MRRHRIDLPLSGERTDLRRMIEGLVGPPDCKTDLTVSNPEHPEDRAILAGTSPGVWDRTVQKVVLFYDYQHHHRKLMLIFTNKTK